GQTALHLAALEGLVENVHKLIQTGADITAADIKGNTPIHLAASQGHVECVHTLLRTGADI
ncbi:ankyrin, partial [Viridothelium virens]